MRTFLLSLEWLDTHSLRHSPFRHKLFGLFVDIDTEELKIGEAVCSRLTKEPLL